MDDSYIDALNYAIKEEITDHYFHDRRVVDEEIAELNAFREEVAGISLKTRKLLADLAALLVNRTYWETFWNLLKAEAPPLEDSSGLEGPLRTVSGRGLGWKSRYRSLVKGLAQEMFDQAAEYLKAHETLVSLVEEVNGDIAKFNRDHDFLMLRSLLCEMDPELVSKKYWLGCSLEGEACLDLEEAMRFRRQKEAEPMFWSLGKIPSRKEIAKAVSQVTSRILKEMPHKIKSGMNGRSGDV